MKCPRCGHEVVSRCGCGARTRPVQVGTGRYVWECAYDPTHGMKPEFYAQPSCLCGRANVGPDKR